jgi:cellulose synthase/poly-beta-1,6-N-acetylglucosamine synthase-like glycosyltransferase
MNAFLRRKARHAMPTFQIICLTAFCLCTAGVLYTYAVYPVVIWAVSRLARPRRDAELSPDNLPRVTILIAAYNEESVIGQRVENVLALDYPADKLELVIASDGSSDKSAEIVSRYHDARIRLLDYPRRRGKATVLVDSVSQIDSDILVLSDANTFFDPDALRALVRPLQDPLVGVVCGKLLLIDHETGRNVDGMYWRYETFLKKCEGRLGALLGSNGAIYAIRRELFPALPSDTLVDDFVIPLMAKLKTGCEIIFEPRAVAREEVAPEIADEFKRRSRIGAGGYQAICRLWPLLNPFRGWVSIAFLSHKVLRWLCPFLLIGMLLCTVALLNQLLFMAIFACELALFVLTPLLAKLSGGGPLLKLIRLGAMFTLMNAALFAGFIRWLRRGHGGTWTRTLRVAELSQEST